jgi:hypothetical protein
MLRQAHGFGGIQKLSLKARMGPLMASTTENFKQVQSTFAPLASGLHGLNGQQQVFDARLLLGETRIQLRSSFFLKPMNSLELQPYGAQFVS